MAFKTLLNNVADTTVSSDHLTTRPKTYIACDTGTFNVREGTVVIKAMTTGERYVLDWPEGTTLNFIATAASTTGRISE